ncbi:Gfo/Idh/MocA family oxidoreductase [candidate division WOR-3 bacterium]|nr:Gfo/Idh/MocA family oxidoreductase [candidate division WOR-3 bacterium]
MSRSIAVVGAGTWGKNLVRVFDSLKSLHTVCDTNPAALSGLPISNGVRLTNDFTTVLNDPEITAVAIATPAVTHYEFVRSALLAEKDVFVEKPLALDLSQAEELVRLAEKKERILMVGHILRYHPAIVQLSEMIEKGELGRIDYIYSNRLNLGRLRTEENILWSFAPHDISVILALVQERPAMVSAHGEAFLQKNIPDVTLTTLEFPSGVHAYTFVSWLHPFKEQRLVVVGSKQMVVFEDGNSQPTLACYPHDIRWHQGRIPVALKGEKSLIELPNEEPLRLECEHFLESIATRIPPRTDGNEGLRVLEVLTAAQQSLQKGGKVIPLHQIRNGSAQKMVVTLKERKPVLTATVAQLQPSTAFPLSTPVEEEVAYAVPTLSEDAKEPETAPFIHPTAIVDPGASIGSGTKIWHFSHISANVRIGKNCVFGQNVFVAEGVTVGDNCKVQNNVSLYKGVCLEEGVFCGPSCVFTNVINPRAFIERKAEFKPTLVKKGASIGANATIVCGNTIGRYALIGAGAVVTRDVPDYALVAGVPARPIGWVCKCGTKLVVDDHRARCPHCGNEYQPDDEGGLKPLKEK